MTLELDRLAPLPIRCKSYPGETARSFSTRLLARNNVSFEVEHDSLKERHIIDGPLSDDQWLAIWRRLGGLHHSAFTAPQYTSLGEWVTARRLCAQCSAGETVSVYSPATGLICLRHRRWMDRCDLPVTQSHVQAEATFRKRLATLGFTHDGPEMRFALVCAGRTAPFPSIHTRDVLTLAHRSALLYPLQVKIAHWIWCEVIPNAAPELPDTAVLERLLEARLEPLQGEAEPWRVSPLIAQLLIEVADLEISGPRNFGRLHPILHWLSR